MHGLCWLLVTVVAPIVMEAAVVVAPASAGTAELDTLARRCELGIALALTNNEAAAESVFVALLSRSPHDARALNNLGNLRLWRGDFDVALEFYAQASKSDSTDPGITLNQATALWLEGDDDAALEMAQAGVRRAGGSYAAARLLGLRDEELSPQGPRSADRAQLSREEVLALLRSAVRAVPADSTKANPSEGASPAAARRKLMPAWRSAGARGAASNDAAASLYWKR